MNKDIVIETNIYSMVSTERNVKNIETIWRLEELKKLDKYEIKNWLEEVNSMPIY